ncbi:MAG: DUF3352 domain-containing protein [Desulfocapsaceae bacterium]|nr:DUF3352 domain-containing protein [Desulfocapsaceae bacterium]
MKKILPLIALAAIVIAGGLFYFYGMNHEQTNPALCVPDDVSFYADQRQLGQVVEDIKKSPVGQVLVKTDYVKMAQDMAVDESGIEIIKKGLDKVSEFFNGPIFKEVLSENFVLAMFPLDDSALQNPIESVTNRFLLISRPKHNVQLLSLLAANLGKDIKPSDVSYGGYTVKRFELQNNQAVIVAVVKDLVLIALDEKTIHDAIDCHDNKKKSLALNANFQKLEGMYKDPLFFMYFGFESIMNQAVAITSKLGHEDSDITKELSGMQAASYGGWTETGAIRDKVVFLVDTAKVDPAMKGFYAIAPEKNTTLNFAPEHAMAYYWTNSVSLPLYWNLFQTKAKLDKEQMDDVRTAVKQQLGMDVDEFVGLFDKQSGLLIQNSADEKKIVPLPDISVFMHLKDSKKLNDLVQDQLKKNGLNVQTADYKGVSIASLHDFAQTGLVPAYAIDNQYLMVATSQEFIRQMVDTMKEGHGLADTPGFKSVSTRLLEENNSVGYLQFGELVKLAKGLISWGSSYSAATMTDNGRKNYEIMTDRLVNPLLDSLSATYSDVGVYSRIMPNQFIGESTMMLKK